MAGATEKVSVAVVLAISGRFGSVLALAASAASLSLSLQLETEFASRLHRFRFWWLEPGQQDSEQQHA